MAKEKPASVAAQLRDLLGKATKADVDELDVEIAALDEQADKLKANRRMLAQAIGLEVPKKRGGWLRKHKADVESAKPTGDAPPKVAGWDADLMPRRKIVLRHLRAVGSCSLDALSAATRISRQGPGNLAACLKHEWFHVSPENVASLTDKGDKASLI